jgi:serine/threonine protein kinase
VIGRGAFGVVMYADLKRKQTIALSVKRSLADNDSGLDSEVYQMNSDNNNNNNKKSTGSNSVVVTKNMSVAVKKLPENATSENFLDLFKELNLMFQVGQHSHIINLIGYSIEESSLYIITDYARHGNLKDFLRKHHEMNKSNKSDILIGPDTLLLYSYQISLGMQYLHSKKVLHRDLAARNILVDDYDSIKIADFGLARNIRTDYYYVQQREGKMPLKWMSPEALSFNRISNESDIWSYGILLWEIYTYGSTPYPSIQAENILANLNSGYRMEKPVDCDQYIYEEIILNCWRLEPKKRPTFNQLVDLFETSQHLNIKNLLNLTKKQENSYDEQTSQSTKVTNASVSDCSFNITSASSTTPPNLVQSPDQQKLNSSSNFLSTSSSSSYNPSSSSSSTSSSSSSSSSVNSPAENAYNSTSSIFYEHNLLNEKLLEKKISTSTSASSSTNIEQIKENNSKSINRIKTPKTQSIRKFAYRTNERKSNLRLLGISKKSINSNRYYDYEEEDDDNEEKQLFSKYSLLRDKSTNNNNGENNNNNNNSNKKNKFLLTYV